VFSRAVCFPGRQLLSTPYANTQGKGESLGSLTSRFKVNTPPFDLKPQEEAGWGLSSLSYRICLEPAKHSKRHSNVCKDKQHK
jgi:hypothetical protein